MRKDTTSWLGLVGLALTVGTLATTPHCSAQTTQRSLSIPGFPVLSKSFPLGSQPASYVIVVDLSGSMTQYGYFPVVRQALPSLIAALPDGDYLSVIGFNEITRQLTTPQVLRSDRSGIYSLLRGLRDPRGREDPTANYTDIGQALRTTVRELRAPGAPTLQFVLFLTDGEHTPGPRTDFPSKTGRAWDALAQTAEQALGDKTVQVTALALGTRTDVRLVQRIFPQATLITVDRTALAAYFRRQKDEVMRDRLTAMVAAELRRAKQSRPSWPTFALRRGGQASVQVEFKPVSERLGASVTAKVLAANGCEASCDGAPVAVPGEVTVSILSGRRDRLLSPASSEPCSVRAKVTYTAEPRAEITRLGLEPAWGAEGELKGTVAGGTATWKLAVWGALALAAVVLVLRQIAVASAPPRLYGRLVCYDGCGDLPPDQPLDGRSQLVLGGSGTDRPDLVLEALLPEGRVVIRARRLPRTWACRLLSWRPRSGAWAHHGGELVVRGGTSEGLEASQAAPDGLAVLAALPTDEPLQSRPADAGFGGSTRAVERQGAEAQTRLYDHCRFAIGPYEFRWDPSSQDEESQDG